MYKITIWTGAVTDDGDDRQHLTTAVERATMPHLFRLVDGDGIVCAYGIADRDNHAPLDELAAAYGLTRIEYLECGEWRPL